MIFDLSIVQIGIKLLFAIICGGAIGMERELSRKPAGLRTNVLICMGATLFMITSRHISGGAPYTDPARLVAQVVAGVGFIGAGVILQSRGSVTGLTTAATIFIVTAVGIAIGEGMFGPAALATGFVIGVLVLLRPLGASGGPAKAHLRIHLQDARASDCAEPLARSARTRGATVGGFQRPRFR